MEVKKAVTELWRRLDEQLHRIEAALPSGTTPLQRWVLSLGLPSTAWPSES